MLSVLLVSVVYKDIVHSLTQSQFERAPWQHPRPSCTCHSTIILIQNQIRESTCAPSTRTYDLSLVSQRAIHSEKSFMLDVDQQRPIQTHPSQHTRGTAPHSPSRPVAWQCLSRIFGSFCLGTLCSASFLPPCSCLCVCSSHSESSSDEMSEEDDSEESKAARLLSQLAKVSGAEIESMGFVSLLAVGDNRKRERLG